MKTEMGAAALVALAAMAIAAERPVRKPLGFADIGVYGTRFDFCDFSVYKIRYSGKSAEPERLARYRTLLHETAASGKGWWRMAHTPAAQQGMRNAWFQAQGLTSLLDRYLVLQH